jgi:hypothetical protein
MRRKLGLTHAVVTATGGAGAAAAAAAAAADWAGSSSSNDGGSTAQMMADSGGGCGDSVGVNGIRNRVTGPLSSSASAAVCCVVSAAAAAGHLTTCGGKQQLDAEDDDLISDLLQLMEDTGADFTNTFRRLALVPMASGSSTANRGNDGTAAAVAAGAGQPPDSDTAVNGSGSGTAEDDFGGFLSQQLAELASPAEMVAGIKPTMPLENVHVRNLLRLITTCLLQGWRGGVDIYTTCLLHGSSPFAGWGGVGLGDNSVAPGSVE